MGSLQGSSRSSSAGVESGAKLRIRKSSVLGGIVILQVPFGSGDPADSRKLLLHLRHVRHPWRPQKSRQVRWRLPGVLSITDSSNRS
jgi:hypothetical protein